MQIIIFGQLTDITETRSLELTGITDTAGMVKELNRQFPALETAAYIIAVDKTIISENTTVGEHSTIALMPPFSGG